MKTPIEPSEITGLQTRMPNDAECHHVLEVVRACACRKGLQNEDVEDLTMGFLGHLLSYVESHPEIDPSVVLMPSWLARAAANWIKNGLRDHWRRQNRESPLPSDSSEENEGEAASFPDLVSDGPSPFTEAVREDFHQRLYNAIADTHLTASQRALLKPFLAGERAVDIAHRTGRSPSTVRHGLGTLRASLRASLQAHDLGDAEIAAFLSNY
ncbi:MAG: hypothetical protein JWN14_2010 [Chthonomonadales bacterium]|nr:hypothetical protein [Chthonomonadales bacterium]